jgi:hypothetical protein
MKCLRVTGNARTRAYSVAVMGENQALPGEDPHNTVMQILRLRMRWELMNPTDNIVFTYTLPITF